MKESRLCMALAQSKTEMSRVKFISDVLNLLILLSQVPREYNFDSLILFLGGLIGFCIALKKVPCPI